MSTPRRPAPRSIGTPMIAVAAGRSVALMARPTLSGCGAGVEDAALVQELGDLDRVQRGALEQVVADDEQVEAGGVAEVLAHATDGDGLAARPLQRRRDVVELDALVRA